MSDTKVEPEPDTKSVISCLLLHPNVDGFFSFLFYDCHLSCFYVFMHDCIVFLYFTCNRQQEVEIIEEIEENDRFVWFLFKNSLNKVNFYPVIYFKVKDQGCKRSPFSNKSSKCQFALFLCSGFLSIPSSVFSPSARNQNQHC